MKQLLLILTCLILAGYAKSQSGNNSNSRLLEITVSGTPFERGFQHGRQFKDQIAEMIDRWGKHAGRTLKSEPDKILDEFFAYARFEDASERHTPGLLEEIRGIAEGAGQDFRSVLMLNLLDEFWVYVDSIAFHHCSGLGVPARGDAPGYIAQNMDLPLYTHDFPMVMKIEPEGEEPGQLILTHPGLVALNGMNDQGVGVCVNTLMQLRASSSGVPVAFMVRGILRRTRAEEVLDFVRNTPHASGQNYLIGIRGEIHDFEASCNEVVPFLPDNSHGTVYHTNHPVVNRDTKSWHPFPEKWTGNSQIRFESVEQRIGGPSFPDEKMIKSALRAKDNLFNPVCNLGTFASTLMTFSDPPFLQVAPGQPDKSDYKRFDF